ncbi:POTRA domain-containing protein [Acetobacter orientalis]|uniref:POTRA domain-containing protein n=1 Tax=Acetobacter orientalis TaxID=146474 RepID=UPI00387029CD
MRKVTTAAVFALLTGSAISTAHAQAFNRTAPKLPARTQFTIPIPAPESLTVTGHRSKPVTTLRGILITEDASRVVTQPPASHAFTTKFKGIDTDIGFLRSHNISKKLSRFLNKRTSIDTLNQAARIVQSAYIKAGRPFVSVVVPKQFVGGGDVVLLVTEYKVNAVNISAGNAGGGVVNFGIKVGDKQGRHLIPLMM